MVHLHLSMTEEAELLFMSVGPSGFLPVSDVLVTLCPGADSVSIVTVLPYLSAQTQAGPW